MYTIREFLPSMLKKNKGHIVNISSAGGMVANLNLTEYCASKAACSMVDECVRYEIRNMKKNVKTTQICPFYINTGMFEGVKRIAITPILDQHWVVWRIITAIRQEEPVVVMPWLFNLIWIAKAVMPPSVSDWMCDVVGAAKCMSEFKGRGNISSLKDN
jgi:all-trans-retinol dehydrogenase (NAD+)